MRLTRTHYWILYCALDDLELATPLRGLAHGIESGEEFTMVPAIPPDRARRATLELLEAGAIDVWHFDSETSKDRRLDPDEARTVLADPATWDLGAAQPVVYAYTLSLTAPGREMFDTAHRRFGHEMERTLEEARKRSTEFLRRHPDFFKRNARYLKELERWVKRGGPKPEPPRFD